MTDKIKAIDRLNQNDELYKFIDIYKAIMLKNYFTAATFGKMSNVRKSFVDSNNVTNTYILLYIFSPFGPTC